MLSIAAAVSSHRSALPLPFLLLLLTQLLTSVSGGAAGVAAEAAAVHRVSVQSVRSSLSILYHGMQVPLFENANANASSAARGPGRYFFQPLALLDCDSTRLIDTEGDAAAAAEDDDDSISNATEATPATRKLLLLTVLLWTDDFLTAARAQLSAGGAAVSVELMPLTELTLTWSSQAGHWLGTGFERRLRLLGGWRDAQKPRARATFTVACDLRDDCRRLSALLDDTDGSAGHLFDLWYRVRCDSKRLLSVQLASRHLQQSPLFSKLRVFAARSAGVALVSEAVVGQLAIELRRAALDEFQGHRQLAGEQDKPAAAAAAFSVDPAAMSALTADAERLLRGSPVTNVGASQWAERVFWQPLTGGSGGAGSAGLRPDRLASLLNRLLTSDGPDAVRPATDASALLDALSGEGDLPLTALAAIRRLLGSRGSDSSDAAATIDVADVRELAASLGSSVAWDAAGARFVPPPSLLLYQLDTARLLRAGVFAVRDATLQYRVSEQRDHVTPLCRAVHGSADYTAASLTAQADLLNLRLRPLLRRADKAASELQRLQAALETAKAAGPGSEVSHRSSDGEWAELPPVLDATELADLQGSIDSLTSQVRALTDSGVGHQPPWQRRFADSFCVLANSGPPPRGMSCRTVSFVVPKASLKSGFLSRRRVRVGTGTAGQNMLQPLEGGKFYRLQLRGCCK